MKPPKEEIPKKIPTEGGGGDFSDQDERVLEELERAGVRLSEATLDVVGTLLEEHGSEPFLDALRVAVANGANAPLAYATAILQRGDGLSEDKYPDYGGNFGWLVEHNRVILHYVNQGMDIEAARDKAMEARRELEAFEA